MVPRGLIWWDTLRSCSERCGKASTLAWQPIGKLGWGVVGQALRSGYAATGMDWLGQAMSGAERQALRSGREWHALVVSGKARLGEH